MHRTAEERGECLEQERTEGGAGESREGRVRRVRSTGEKLRRKPGADERSGDDAGNGQRARDEPLLQSEERREDDKADRNPVDLGHADQATGRLGGPSYNGRRAM